MEKIEEFLRPAIDLLPEQLREYWLVLIGLAALVVLLPLAWYKRHQIRRLIGLQPRPIKEPPKVDEDIAQFVPPPGLPGTRRVFIEGVPSRLRMVVVASLGKGEPIPESAAYDYLDQIRWGLGAIARQDQATVRSWPVQISANGFPAVFHRSMHKPEPYGEPSHWVLIAGSTPPRPRSILLGLALYTDDSTLIGNLVMEPGDWVKALHIETLDAPRDAGGPGAGQQAVRPLGEDQGMKDGSTVLPKSDNGPAAER
jgi:hypothetical protein